MKWQDIAQLVVLLFVIAGVISVFVVIGQQAGNSDNQKAITNSLWTVYGIGFATVLALAFGNYLLIKSGSSYKETLGMIMTHVSFFMAYVAMGTTLLSVKNS
jgi:predicted membrane protein